MTVDGVTLEPVQIIAEDPSGNPVRYTTEVTRIKTGNSCEYRLEFANGNEIDWAIGEVAGDRGPAQRHNPSPCVGASFVHTPTTSSREFEEQTVYYWAKAARDYSVANLWVTPQGWTSGSIKHARDLLGPTVLTDGAFNRSCLPDALAGCMRSWPHEGPKIHFRAGQVSDELVAHEYGHYAAGFVFGHMDAFGIDGYDITNCAKRSFQEGIAETFERLFMHHVASFSATLPLPNVSGQTEQWLNRCGRDNYVMGAPLWQSVHQAVWGRNHESPARTVTWPSPQAANSAMIDAFSYGLAITKGHRIHQLAYAMLDQLERTQRRPIFQQVRAIFASHGLVPKSLGDNCLANDECVSKYCDHGNNTSHTDRCMPTANQGQIGDPCSNDNQCASASCEGLSANPNGSWNPGRCAAKLGLGEVCSSNAQCGSSYCDAGNNTSHTSLCMPSSGAGMVGDICSNDSHCGTGNCSGLVATTGGTWIPGHCADKKNLGQRCDHNGHCASGYCDAGWNTSKTNLCMPKPGTGARGQPCSHDNQCATLRCDGLRASSAGNWIPGRCGSKVPLGQSCTQNAYCVSGYCDAGNNTSHTGLCMPAGAAGTADQPCSNDNQCVSSNCAGLTTNAYGDWVPGKCANKLLLGTACTANHQCASSYCDTGNNTSHTDRCMPGPGAGSTGDRCSHDNQCASSNCVGLTPLPGGAWSPGTCSTKFGLGSSCQANDHCASGYCDIGNNTSHTARCMPGARAGRSGQPCSHDNQCRTGNCVGESPRSDGSWNPGTCS